MFSSSVAIVLLALITSIASLNDTLNSRNPCLSWNGTVSSACFFVQGALDGFGRDSGVSNTMRKDSQGLWQYDLMTELSSSFHVRIRRVNKNNESGLSRELGETHNLTVPGYLSPLPLLETIVNVDGYPPSPNLAYRITINDTDQRYCLSSVGSRQNQAAIYFFLGAVPIFTGFASIRIYLYAFYAVKINKFGKARKESILPMNIQSKMHLDHWFPEIYFEAFKKGNSKSFTSLGKAPPSRLLYQARVDEPFS